MIRTQSPYPDSYSGEGNRIERFYYDGVRRIQEVVIDPAYSMGEALMSGSSAMQSAAQQSQQSSGVSNAAINLEEESTPVAVEQQQVGTSSSSSGGTSSDGGHAVGSCVDVPGGEGAGRREVFSVA